MTAYEVTEVSVCEHGKSEFVFLRSTSHYFEVTSVYSVFAWHRYALANSVQWKVLDGPICELLFRFPSVLWSFLSFILQVITTIRVTYGWRVVVPVLLVCCSSRVVKSLSLSHLLALLPVCCNQSVKNWKSHLFLVRGFSCRHVLKCFYESKLRSPVCGKVGQREDYVEKVFIYVRSSFYFWSVRSLPQ